MTIQPTIFGGDTGISYEQLQRKRKLADQLMQKSASAPRNVGEGLTAIGNALLARSLNKKADRRDAELKSQFDSQFAELAPNQQGLIDLANSPYAGKAHKSVIEALMKGAPNFVRGGTMMRGGRAVVGENGPEVVRLPAGAQVLPTSLMASNSEYDPDSQERLMAPGADTEEPPIDPRELLMSDQFDMGSRFDDANAYQTAELSAKKLMQLEPEYAAPVEADINTTEGQRLAYLRRMMFADLALQDPKLAESMTRMDNSIASRFGALGRLYTDDDFELGKLMSEQFANAVLRNDSGAAAPTEEVRRYAGQYFPQPNEGPSELAAKKAMRREVMRSLMQALGGDAAPAVKQLQEEMEMLRQQADVPEGGQEISEEDREFLKSLGIE